MQLHAESVVLCLDGIQVGIFIAITQAVAIAKIIPLAPVRTRQRSQGLERAPDGTRHPQASVGGAQTVEPRCVLGGLASSGAEGE